MFVPGKSMRSRRRRPGGVNEDEHKMQNIAWAMKEMDLCSRRLLKHTGVKDIMQDVCSLRIASCHDSQCVVHTQSGRSYTNNISFSDLNNLTIFHFSSGQKKDHRRQLWSGSRAGILSEALEPNENQTWSSGSNSCSCNSAQSSSLFACRVIDLYFYIHCIYVKSENRLKLMEHSYHHCSCFPSCIELRKV